MRGPPISLAISLATSLATSLETEREVSLPGILCLTGGGGKTSLLFALGRALASAGHNVLATTTTRMHRPLPAPGMAVAFPENPASIAVPANSLLFAAKEPPADGDTAKVHGYGPEELDALLATDAASHILVEADGAAGKPLKAPADHEPVIPRATRAVVALLGLSCFLAPFGPETVFRPERVTAITGLGPGCAVTPEAVAALIVHPQGLFKNTPPGASRLLFCNQADLPGTKPPAHTLAEILAGEHPGFLQGFYLGSLRKDGLQCLSLPTQ